MDYSDSVEDHGTVIVPESDEFASILRTTRNINCMSKLNESTRTHSRDHSETVPNHVKIDVLNGDVIFLTNRKKGLKPKISSSKK